MASLTRFSLTSSSALCRLLINRNAGLVQQHLPSMIIPSATQQRSIVTTPIRRDIDSAAKYIGAGAATVGVAGAGAGQLILIMKRKEIFRFFVFCSSRYWNSIRFTCSCLCTKSKLKTTALLICYLGFCFIRGYGSLLSYDGIHVIVCFLEHLFNYLLPIYARTFRRSFSFYIPVLISLYSL